MVDSESLRPYLKKNNLFVRDINRGCSPAIVRATLEKAGGAMCKVVIPLDFKTDQSTHIGQAYLNFATEAEAESCLDRIRFKLIFGKQRAKVLFAPGGSQADKDRVWGPYSYKFQILVKNLSEEVEVEAFYEFFSRFGEILQCKTDTDNYGQYFGQVQYMDAASVAAAVDGANGTRWHGAVIQVVPHHKAAQAESVATPRRVMDVASTSSFPALGAPSSSSAAAASSAPSRQQVRQLETAHFQQQQQQAPPPAAAAAAPQRPVPVNFALQALDGSGGGSSGGGGGRRVSLDSPLSRPLASSSGGSGGLHMNAPVVAPVAAPVAAPIGSHSMSPVAVTTGPGASSRVVAVGSTGPAAAAVAAGAGRMSLLDRIMLNRADGSPRSPVAAGSVAAAAAPAGPEGVMMAGAGGNGLLAPTQQPGTPNGLTAAGRMNCSRRKGGLIKSLTRMLDQVSELLCCPITHEVLVDPVVAADGITYERSAITHWLTAHDTSPMTNMRLANYELLPNSLVRTLIEELM